MTENNQKYCKIETQGFQDLCRRLGELERENERLTNRNRFLERCVKGLKLNNAAITLERNELCDKLHEIQQLSMFEFGNRYCSNESLEEDGKAFARALLGGK